jgi:hypothetical protein
MYETVLISAIANCMRIMIGFVTHKIVRRHFELVSTVTIKKNYLLVVRSFKTTIIFVKNSLLYFLSNFAKMFYQNFELGLQTRTTNSF